MKTTSHGFQSASILTGPHSEELRPSQLQTQGVFLKRTGHQGLTKTPQNSPPTTMQAEDIVRTESK